MTTILFFPLSLFNFSLIIIFSKRYSQIILIISIVCTIIFWNNIWKNNIANSYLFDYNYHVNIVSKDLKMRKMDLNKIKKQRYEIIRVSYAKTNNIKLFISYSFINISFTNESIFDELIKSILILRQYKIDKQYDAEVLFLINIINNWRMKK
jgi:hypothetical protein